MSQISTNRQPHVSCRPRGFTLVELLVAVTVGVVFLAMLLGVVAMSLRLVYKNISLNDATTATRLVQEYLTREVSQAIAVPTFSDPSGPASNHYAEIRYRVLIGPVGKVAAKTLKTSKTIELICPVDLVPKAGDYLMIVSPNIGPDGASIIQVEDSRGPGTAGSVVLTLSDSIANLTLSGAIQSDIEGDTTIAIQRERCFRVNPPPTADSPVCTLEWFETTKSYVPSVAGSPPVGFDPAGVVICTKVDARSRHLFSRDPATATPAEEPSLIWQFNYLSDQSNTLIGQLVGGFKGAYMATHAEGLIMPKSGNPLGIGPMSPPPSTTTTSSTTTTTTTSIKTTSIKTTSTTKTTTTKTTSIKTTSTTKTTTTKTTTTSTTKTTTTKTTTTSIKTTTTTSIKTTSTTKPTTTSTKPTTTTTSIIVVDG